MITTEHPASAGNRVGAHAAAPAKILQARNGSSSGITVEVIDPRKGPAWDNLVRSHPRSSFFHTSAWSRVLTQTYGHQPNYLHFSQNGESAALLPLLEVTSPFTGRRGVSLPFSDFCGLLLFPGADADLSLEPIRDLIRERRWRYLELRGGEGFAGEAAAADDFCGHVLDLRAGADTVFAGFTESVRRAVRKGAKSSLTFHLEHSITAVEEFCGLHAATRRRHGAPPQPAAFFEQIHQEVIAPGFGFVALARDRGRAVAAAVFFLWGKRAIYKFGASDEAAQNLRANNLVMWEAIRFLIAQGIEELDFGRTAHENEGLRRFKLGWGAKEKVIPYRRLGEHGDDWSPVPSRETGFSRHIFRRLPRALNQLAGRLLYPHLD